MGRNCKIRELIKTILIILLSFTALLQLYTSGIVRSIPAVVSSKRSEYDSQNSVCPASYPTTAVVTFDGGTHYAVEYSSEEIRQIYDCFVSIIAEALGTASKPESASKADWRTGMSSESLYFEYPAPFPLELLAAWAGTDTALEGSAARIMLVMDSDSGVYLLYMLSDGSVLRCSSSASAFAFGRAISNFSSNGGRFVWELAGSGYALGDYEIVPASARSLDCLNVSIPLSTEISAAAAEAFGINYLSGSGYTETDGTIVFVEGDCTLRLSSDGVLSYRRTAVGDRLMSEDGGIAQIVELARELVDCTAGQHCGAAEIYLTELTYTSAGYILGFRYYYNGAELYATESGYAARVEFTENSVAYANIEYLCVTPSGNTVTLLFEIQSAAAALGSDGLALRYIDRGTASISPAWTVNAKDGADR